MLTRSLLVFFAALTLAPLALADGGPDPGVLQGGAGIAGSGGEIRYVTLGAGRSTTLEAVATHSGRVLRWTTIHGAWGIPLVDYSGTVGGLSANGSLLVLQQAGVGSCTPSGCTLLRRSTSFQLVDPHTFRHRSTVRLRGDFSYDALSPDGARLYLIEHTSTANANKYVVRAYDLRRHRLLPGAIADRTQRGWKMQGIPMARASSANGRYVYTLYANPGGYPFVHALDAVAATAHCIGVPWIRRSNEGDLDTLRLGPDGRTLRVGMRRERIYFSIDTRSYRVTILPGTPAGVLP